MIETAFKEWSSVCYHLSTGRQSIIIRKGGIAEGRDGFQFKHREFFLFPTRFHDENQFLKADWQVDADAYPANEKGETVTILHCATVEKTEVMTDWEKVAALSHEHCWTEDAIRARFDYKDAPGVSVAWVEIRPLLTPLKLEWQSRFGGCRSWIDIPASKLD